MGEERQRDPFDFMLRGNGQNVRDNSSQEEDESDYHFRDLMFGNSKEKDNNSKDNNLNGSGFLSQIDLDEVLYHVDTLITSGRELKPLFGKVRPLFDHFINKNKS